MTEKKSTTTKSSGSSIWKIYFWLVSIASLFAFLILYGNGIYSFLEYSIISDQEYLDGQYYYYEDISRECEDLYRRENGISGDGSFSPDTMSWSEMSEANLYISECITSKESQRQEDLITQRSYDMKTDALSAGVWGTLFLILFLIHYPSFRKSYKKD